MRQTLRFAAVQGRQFSKAVLETAENGRDLTPHLTEAADRGLIEPEPGAAPGQWRFRHALLRDAIYGSLLEDSRLPMHGIIGQAIETLNAGHLDEVCEALAFHFEAADLPARSLPYLIQSARKALQVYDLAEVDRVLSLARARLHQDPDLVDQAKLDRMVGIWLEAMTLKGDFARAIEVARAFLPRLRAGGNERAIEIAVSHYDTALTHVRDYPQAIELALNGIAQAQKRGDDMSAAWLHLPLLRAYEETNAVPDATFLALAEETLRKAESLGETRLKMQIIYLQAAHFRSIGKMTTGWARLCAVLDETKASGNVVFSRYFHLVRAEILLKVAGLMKEPPPGPGYPDRSVVPAPKPGLGDIMTLLKLRLKARQMAAADLAYFRANFDGDGAGVHEARALTCEALLNRDRTKRDASLRRAAMLAEEEGLMILKRRIEEQL